MSLNQVILIGRLGKDPETRYTGGGQAVCSFSIATDESWKDRNGEKQKRTEWHRIVAWGKTAEIAQEYLKKGREVSIIGKLQTRDWQDKEGVKRYSTEIIVQRLILLSNGGSGHSAPAHSDDDAPHDYADRDSGQPPRSSGTGTEISDEDIPF